MADRDIEDLRDLYRYLKKAGYCQETRDRQEHLDGLFKRLAGCLKGGPPAREPRVETLYLNTDGASRGNPGPAGAGGVLSGADGQVVETYAVYLGEKTNNEAEYMALIEGLKRAKVLAPKKLVVRSDSLLLVKQMKGLFKVKKKELVHLHLAARKAMPACPVIFEHVPREENSEADRMANLGVDSGPAPSGH